MRSLRTSPTPTELHRASVAQFRTAGRKHGTSRVIKANTSRARSAVPGHNKDDDKAASGPVRRIASGRGSHEAGGAVVARKFPACRKECEFAAGTGTGKPQAARQAGHHFDRRACGCKKSWFAWSRVPVPKPYCGLVGKRPSLSLTPRPVEIL